MFRSLATPRYQRPCNDTLSQVVPCRDAEAPVKPPSPLTSLVVFEGQVKVNFDLPTADLCALLNTHLRSYYDGKNSPGSPRKTTRPGTLSVPQLFWGDVANRQGPPQGNNPFLIDSSSRVLDDNRR
jgi:hypothetical protein